MAGIRDGAGTQGTGGAARAYGEGSAGWVIDTPTFTRQGQDYPCRATTILHQEEGAWKIVHQHFSFGVPNEAVEIFKDVVGALLHSSAPRATTDCGRHEPARPAA